jgi:hypothetical protein
MPISPTDDDATGELWIVDGHLPNCAYLRSLDEPWEHEDVCDCELETESEVEDDDA